MARTDRLYALTEFLRRRHHPVTVGQISDHLSVGERTIYRDLAVLRREGVPIEGDVGRGGGVRLRPDYSMPPVGLSVEEAAGLWLALRLADLQPTPWPRATGRALAKVFGALPAARRRALRELMDRVLVSRPASPELALGASAIEPSVFSACERGLRESCSLRLDYRDAQGRTTTRSVEPHGLQAMPPLWYLLAWDPLRGASRAFRIDRIRSARVEPEGRFAQRDPRDLFPEIERELGTA